MMGFKAFHSAQALTQILTNATNFTYFFALYHFVLVLSQELVKAKSALSSGYQKNN
jgi:hypothetical protein